MIHIALKESGYKYTLRVKALEPIKAKNGYFSKNFVEREDFKLGPPYFLNKILATHLSG